MTATPEKPRPVPKGMQLHRGVLLDARLKGYEKDLWLFGRYLAGVWVGGEQKLWLFKSVVSQLWPEPIFIWDEWCDLFFGALCGAKETVERLAGVKIETNEKWWRRVICTGSGASGKSAKAALWVLLVWLCAQQVTTVVLCSTSMDQLKRRIWHALLKWINSSVERLPLEPLPGDCEIRWAAGDKLSCIFGIPVQAGGDESVAIDKIKGLHNMVTLLVIDEMTSMPDAIVDGGERNLRKGTIEHQVIGLGNAGDPNDLHGRNMEPEGGWNSVNPESIFWLNKLGGCSLHFDGLKSPRLRDDAKYHYYIGAEDIRYERKFNGGESNPRWWSEVRGWWAPTGLSLTLMDMNLLDQFHAKDSVTWKGIPQMGGAFDPSFEGMDRAVLYPFKWGEYSTGQTGIEYLEPVIVSVDMTQDKRWLHYSLADAVQAHCERLKIPPENFVEDITSEGGGFHAILSARWSDKINGVEFGGAAEKTAVFSGRPATWNETVGNKVSMIWMMFRAFVEGDQVRGLVHPETIKELTSRLRQMKGGKIIAEPKKEMKARGVRSPDFGDACCLAAFLLYLKGIGPKGATAGGAAVDLTDWNAFAEHTAADNTDNDYTDENAAFG